MTTGATKSTTKQPTLSHARLQNNPPASVSDMRAVLEAVAHYGERGADGHTIRRRSGLEWRTCSRAVFEARSRGLLATWRGRKSTWTDALVITPEGQAYLDATVPCRVLVVRPCVALVPLSHYQIKVSYNERTSLAGPIAQAGSTHNRIVQAAGRSTSAPLVRV